jgi:hypothetical protein
MRRSTAKRELVKDLLFIFIGAITALILSENGAIDWLVGILGNHFFASFVSGIFFTSVFTIAPASVALTHIVLTSTEPVWVTALWGAMGAVCGDLALFFFIRDRFAEDLRKSFKPSFIKHIMNSFHLGFMKWLAPIFGALIIASPLPDELGLTLLGLSKTRLIVLIPISFFMNLLGIYGLIWFAHWV